MAQAGEEYGLKRGRALHLLSVALASTAVRPEAEESLQVEQVS